MATDKQPPHSLRACNHPVGNGPYMAPVNGKGCGFCNNQDKYGFGSSVCGRCNRCHGCGSTNNGIGPVQSVYFGGKWVVQQLGKVVGDKDKEKDKGSGTGTGTGGESAIRPSQP